MLMDESGRGRPVKGACWNKISCSISFSISDGNLGDEAITQGNDRSVSSLLSITGVIELSFNI